MNITLTGAAGNVGSAVCRELVKAGHTVKAVDRLYRKDLPVPVRILDLLRQEAAYDELEGAEMLVHLANHPTFRGRESQRVLNENVTMNMNVFQAAADVGIRRIVFSSTIQVFTHTQPGPPKGNILHPYLPLDGHMPENVGNAYSLSKVLSERMLRYFAAEYEGLSCVALRLPSVVLPEWLPRYRDELLQRVAPHEGFTFLRAEDAGTLAAALAAANLTPGYRCYFPAARAPSNGRPVADLLREFYPQVPLRKPANQMDSLVDLTELERDTGWQPAFNSLGA